MKPVEAKLTFAEALQAHEVGLYRAVPRLLFPEIERVTHKELDEGAARTAGLREMRNCRWPASPRRGGD